jgi:hypothetical protein
LAGWGWPIGLDDLAGGRWYTTPTRLQAIIRYYEAQGAVIFNRYMYLIEDGGMKQVDIAKLRFKEKVDPSGLMNPGKMRAWSERWVEGWLGLILYLLNTLAFSGIHVIFQ